MAYTHRSSTAQGNATGGALTVTAPATLTNGDLIVIIGYLESDTNTWASVGAGFTQAATVTNTGLFTLTVWWKWAASEPGSWTWTPTTTQYRNVLAAAYIFGSGTGNAYDISGSNQGDGVAQASQTAPSITTTAAHDLLIYAYGNFSGNNISTTSGAATTVRGGIGGTALVDNVDITTASATGTTVPTAGLTNEDFAALHVAFFLTGVAGGGGGTAGKNVMTLGFG